MQAVQADQARGGGVEHPVQGRHLLPIDKGNVKQQPKPVFTIMEKAPTRAFLWLKAFSFKTLC